ncbi:MAG TPA: TIR domain-containing protein [Actinophytocola sp.]|uniref:toll/interleukin-1 receptor domain-containing protein n=1 Tax=Actinophytocola sp. TaxID=1872138 RepID=UPI002DDCACE4|nr:TIR domain-containing protein [Actinophytocola sp.]HEV2779537.1 TIR domain-containing protein [Actinophytocola sp.]
MSPDKATYSAFISYSHALDGKLAPTLQREIERFAKPWFRMRMLRVFRDNASLSAQPDLWSAIERALSRSDWLILMASPEAARSPWVNQEVSWWLANRSPDRLLIVLTSGEFSWNQERGDVADAASTALPPALHGALDAEPRWVDLRWLHEADQVDRSNPRLRECVADIVATIREIPKDLLVGEHIRQHRRTIRLAWSAASALALLLVLSVIGFSVAVVQRNEAVNQARIATARQLAASAAANLGTRIDLAQLLAVEAYRMERGPQTRSALFQSVTASPNLVRTLPIGVPVTAIAGSADARVAVAGTETGRAVRWDLASNTVSEITVGGAPVVDVAISADGGKVIATDGSTTLLWDAAGNRRPVPAADVNVKQVAISPSGKLAATLAYQETASYDPDRTDATLTLVDGQTGKQVNHTPTSYWAELALVDDDTITAMNGGGLWRHLSTDALATTGAPSDTRERVPAGHFVAGYSATAEYFAYMKYQNVVAHHNITYDHDEVDLAAGTGYFGASMPISRPELLRISDRGTYVAAAGGGSLYAARLIWNAGGDLPDPIHLSGQGRAEALAFLGDGPELVSAAEGALTLWNLAQASPLSVRPRADLPSSPNAGGIPQIAVTADGTRVAVTNDAGQDWNADWVAGPAIHDFSGPELTTTRLDPEYRYRVPLWSPDGGRLLLFTNGGAADLLENGRVTAQWPARGEATIIGAQFSADGSRVVLADEVGGLQIRDAASGEVRTSTPSVLAGNSRAFADHSAVNGAAETAALVALDQSVSGPVVVIDAKSGTSHELPGDPAVSVTFSNDNLFVQHEDDSLDVWDVTGTTKRRTITGNIGYADALTVIPHTGLLARLRGDGTAVISDLESGDVLGSIRLPPMTRSSVTDPWSVTTLTATRNTGELITATSGGQLVYWRLTEDAWLDVACEAAGRDLTPADWRRVAASDPPADLRCRR